MSVKPSLSGRIDTPDNPLYRHTSQEVCPWNSFAEPASDPAFIPRDGLDGPSLIEWMGMT